MKELKENFKKVFSLKGLVALVAVAAVMMYFLTRIDIIPDTIPVLGMFDDAFFVIAVFFLGDWLFRKVFPSKHKR